MASRRRNYLSSGLAGLLTVICMTVPAYAVPTSTTVPTLGSVIRGTADVVTSGANQTITTSNRALINWSNFDIGSGAKVEFKQPNGNSIAVNRVTGLKATEIYGSLTANGKIVLANGNGIVFGKGANVSVGGLVATTSTITNSNYDEGNATGTYKFTPGSNPEASIINAGTINVTNGGLAALVAPQVSNYRGGVITANAGKVTLASGNKFAVDFAGDHLLDLQVTDAVADALVEQVAENGGLITANGGQVTLTAAAGKHVVDSLINMTGVIQADTVDSSTGRIELKADKVSLSGPLLARGDAGEKGGVINVVGRNIVDLCNCATIDARGEVYGSGHGEGQVTIRTDKIKYSDGASIYTNDNVTFEPYSKGTTIGVAGASGDLEISTALLNHTTAGSVTIGNTADTAKLTADGYTWRSDVKMLNGSGNIAVNGGQTMGNHTFLAHTVSGNVALGSSGAVTSSHTGDAIVLAASGGKFENNNGSSALQATAGRWLVYSNRPAWNTFGNLNSHNTAVWNTIYTGAPQPQTGNRYVFAYQPTVTLTPRDLTKTYGTDSTDAVAHVTVDYVGLHPGVAGAFNADTIDTAVSGSATKTSIGSPATSDVGAYPILMSGMTPINGYKVKYGKGTLTVNPADLVVTADGATKIYGDADPAFTYGVTGLQNGQSATDVLTGSLTRDAGENVGNYNILQGGLVSNSNYTITYVGNTLVITPATLTVTANPQTKVYGSGDPALTYGVAGLKFADTEGSVLTGGLTRNPGENVGAYSILQGSLASNSNYAISFIGNDLTITPYTLTVVADNKYKALGAPVPTLTYTYGTLQNGDTASVFVGGLATTATSTSLTGSYPITQGTLDAGSNYVIDYTPGTLDVGSLDDPHATEYGGKVLGRRGTYGTLLSIVNTGASTTSLANLAPAAGGNSPADLADLAPAAGGNVGAAGVTPLIQCTETTPCDINQ